MLEQAQREEAISWLRLTLAQGLNRSHLRRLLTQLGPPDQWLTHSPRSLPESLAPEVAQQLLRQPSHWPLHVQRLEQWLAQSIEDGIPRALIPLGDAHYPECLLHIPDPPVLLYAMGHGLSIPQWPVMRGLGMVGSRQPTPQGLSNARQFAQHLVTEGLTIVSGMALGIDAAAHEGALDGAQSDQLSTIAVVGTGLDRVYPSQHQALARRLAEQAVLLSEYPLGTAPRPHHFPQRNRIISGLAFGTLVVEAARASGSLLTARLASEQGREVFAIPGSIHAPQAEGCHWIIRQGATLVTSPADILEELTPWLGQLSALPLEPSRPAHQTRAAVQASPETPSPFPQPMEWLGHDPVDLDTLVARSGESTAQWQAWLLDWELEGWVARLPGGRFQRCYQV